jgi:hypothetical protein
VNVVSGDDQFITAISGLDETQRLSAAMRDADGSVKVLLRIYEITERPIDERYENPWDVALAIYIWLLSQRHPSFAWLAAKRIAGCRNCWWARRVGEKIRPYSPLRAVNTVNSSLTKVVGRKPEAVGRAPVAATYDLDAILVSYLPEWEMPTDQPCGSFLRRTIVKPAKRLWVEISDVTSPWAWEAFHNYGASEMEAEALVQGLPSANTIRNYGTSDKLAKRVREVPV